MAQEILDVLRRVSARAITEENPEHQEGAQQLVREVGRLLAEDKLPLTISAIPRQGDLLEGKPLVLASSEQNQTRLLDRPRVLRDHVVINSRLMRQARILHNLSQRTIADTLGLKDDSSISRIETGKAKVSKENAAKIAEMLGLDLNDFILSPRSQ